MNSIQYGGILISAAGVLAILGWILWKVAQRIELPFVIAAGLLMAVCGLGIVIASLIYERSKDVKKESFFKD